MEDTWSLASVTHTILDCEELMFAAMYSLLSCTGVFKGDCGEFCHLISNHKDNGYLALYHIVCVAHRILGQTMTYPVQPFHKKIQAFSENVAQGSRYFS
jgi:hypothetical protein